MSVFNQNKKAPGWCTALSPLEGMLVAVQSASLRRYDPDQVPRVVSPAAKLSVIFYSPSGGTGVLKSSAPEKSHCFEHIKVLPLSVIGQPRILIDRLSTF